MAQTSDTVALDAAEIAIYILLFPLIIFLGIRHGSKHSLGFVYLCLFAVLRIVADGLGIANRNLTDESAIITTQAISSAGLSPLLLILAAFAHEAHHYQVKAALPHNQAQNVLRQLRSLQGLFHVLSAGGMGLIVYGAEKSASKDSDHDSSTWTTVRKVGCVLMLLAAIAEIIYAFYVWSSVRRTRKAVRPMHLISLAVFTFVGGLFVGARAVYSVVYTFDTNPDISPITGTFVVKLICIVLVQLLAVACLITGAWLSRNIRRDIEYKSIQPAERFSGGGGGRGGDSAIPLAPEEYSKTWYSPSYDA
ncbi:uncharacterized protein Z520_03686 [Fonsecaea multimorphosa CBS 102226]|uniref:DUF7702 domain-containing protein n=1 Tax=Fonsecaea multimorphosa CBS 102226 TaxID=1442371 RepID=A0A0D2KCW7_9EURO|nr:uncharacterized protein Z520_03686 [Fonsecaea multimorphosa CBS 102226]KIY01020.1 hypothetical protein Z520_03686 [Fonsecaea multimorphosa CBS 102226]OAL27604.1 hypothetical protein AYO22_03508 [Fonsecaea multimorphosa]